MPRRRIHRDLHPAQDAFLDAAALFRGFVGGRGAGKSYIGALDLILRAQPGRLYMAAAPTYPLMRDATLRTFLDQARALGVLREVRRGDMTAILANGAEVLFRSADDPDATMRGPNLSGVWLDEASIMDRAAFDLSIAALRQGGAQGWLSATFTPRGKAHWTYEVFGAGRPDTALFHARTADNPFNPPSFASTLRRQYTSAFAEQELDGCFIDAGGRLARRDWFRVTDARPDPKAGRWVRAWDFAATEATVSGSDPDWTVGALMTDAGGMWTLAHVVRARVAGGQVEALVRQTAALDGLTTEIALEQEPGSSGKIAAAYLVRALAGYSVRATPATGDKVTRAMPMLAQAEAGNLRLVAGDWTADWLDEMAAFPDGSHDDQVDAAALAFATLTHGADGWGPCGWV